MAAQDCIGAATKAAGGKLNLEQIAEAIEVLQERQKTLMAQDASLSMEDAALKAADELGAEAMQAAAYKKRAAYINARRRAETLAYLRDKWADQPVLGAESFLVGTNLARTGSRASVSVEQSQLTSSYVGGMLSDLEISGTLDALSSGSYDDAIARALWQMRQKTPDMTGIDKQSIKIAEIIDKWQESARINANKAGSMIGRLDNYITRQSHDPLRMSSRGKEQWIKDILPRLDPETFKGGDEYEFLSATYDGLVSGVHFKQSGAPKGFTGPRNIAKSMSQERVLHFRSADDWSAYNRDYGMGNLRESVIGTLSQMGEQTALMRRLGTNPESNWDQVLDEFAKDLKGDAAKLKAFDDARKGALRNRFREVDGTAKIPVSGDLARYSSITRAWVNMTSLGASIASSVTDIPVAASELRYQGRGILSGMGEMMSGLTTGRKTAEQRQILANVGVFLEGMRGAATSRFSVDDTMTGAVNKWQNLYFRMNLQSWWTDTHRASVGLSMSHGLASDASKAFDGLNPDLRRSLDMYGIDSGRWDLIRSAPLSEANGKQFMTTENMADIPSESLAAYIESQGRKASKPAIEELRLELGTQLRNYISDRVSYAVLEPDARTRAMIRQGTQPGTWGGELLRFMGQFKSFSFSFMQKAIGRELYGRGYTPTEFGGRMTPMRDLMAAMTTGSPSAQLMGMGQLVLWSSVFGYMALAAKDLIKGREPRDPLDKKTWMASFIQGGGLGIYTDFIFGEASRFGNKPLETLAGPAAGRIASMIDLFQKSRLAATGEDVDLASNLMRQAQSSTPFASLFYIKPILDYAIFYRAQEWLNPGTLRRMEQRVKRENNQDFLIRPSEVIR